MGALGVIIGILQYAGLYIQLNAAVDVGHGEVDNHISGNGELFSSCVCLGGQLDWRRKTLLISHYSLLRRSDWVGFTLLFLFCWWFHILYEILLPIFFFFFKFILSMRIAVTILGVVLLSVISLKVFEVWDWIKRMNIALSSSVSIVD